MNVKITPLPKEDEEQVVPQQGCNQREKESDSLQQHIKRYVECNENLSSTS